MWLDPAPASADIPALYRSYYTHGDGLGTEDSLVVDETKPRSKRLIRQLGRHAYLMYIGARPPGRILEIGAGDGSRLAEFARRGWDVTAQEMDPEAGRRTGRRYGFTVLTGDVTRMDLEPDQFDAIIMNHVIEHVENPLEMLATCRRLLREDGILSVVTPNFRSLGHRHFGPHWRGLEPPRHLFLYSPVSLARLARRAGFSSPKVFTTAINAAGTISQESLVLKEGADKDPETRHGLRRRLWAHGFRTVEYLALALDKNCGEECVLLASRGSDAF